MSVGKVTNSIGNAFIQIVDIAQNKLTEYSTGQTRTIENYSAWLADNSKGNVTTGAGLAIGQTTTYNPQANLTCRWAEGLKQSTTYHYYKEEVKSWWGAKDDLNYTGRYEDMSTINTQVGKPEINNNPLGTGTFIATSEQSDNLKMSAKNQTSTIYWNDPATQTKSGLGGFYHHWHHNWYKQVGSRQTYVYSLKADNPISVGILGVTNPHINQRVQAQRRRGY